MFDVYLSFLLIGALCYLLYRMYKYDKHMDDVRVNGQFSPIIYPHETPQREFRRERRKMKKYGSVATIIFVLILYIGLRANDTISSIL